MRPLIRRALWLSAVAGVGTGLLPSWPWDRDRASPSISIWSVTVFGTAAFTIGNLNALALEPLGHIAGTAASLMGALATVGGAIGGALIGQLYDGTAVPVAICIGLAQGLAAVVMIRMPREAVDD